MYSAVVEGQPQRDDQMYMYVWYNTITGLAAKVFKSMYLLRIYIAACVATYFFCFFGELFPGCIISGYSFL